VGFVVDKVALGKLYEVLYLFFLLLVTVPPLSRANSYTCDRNLTTDSVVE
jgi:hypothetical protein